MNQIQQTQLPSDDALDGIFGRALGLIDENVLSLAWCVVLGAIFTIATMSVIKRIWLPPLPDADKATADARSSELQKWSTGLGFSWTMGILVGYMMLAVSAAFGIAVVVAFGLAMISAALVPYLFDMLRWAWSTLMPAIGQWILARFRRTPESE